MDAMSDVSPPTIERPDDDWHVVSEGLNGEAPEELKEAKLPSSGAMDASVQVSLDVSASAKVADDVPIDASYGASLPNGDGGSPPTERPSLLVPALDEFRASPANHVRFSKSHPRSRFHQSAEKRSQAAEAMDNVMFLLLVISVVVMIVCCFINLLKTCLHKRKTARERRLASKADRKQQRPSCPHVNRATGSANHHHHQHQFYANQPPPYQAVVYDPRSLSEIFSK